MSPQSFVVKGSRCVFVTRLRVIIALRIIFLQSLFLCQKSSTEGFPELQQPTTKDLEGRRQIETLDAQDESLLLSSETLVKWLIEPRLIRQLLKPLSRP